MKSKAGFLEGGGGGESRETLEHGKIAILFL